MTAIQSHILLMLTACAPFDKLGPGYSDELDEYQTQSSNEHENSHSMEDSSTQIELISDSECFNPCTFQTQAEDISYVIYSADGWPIGRSEYSETDYHVEYNFHTLGLRTVKAEAFDRNDRLIASDSQQVQVDDNRLILIAPTECENPCTFKAEVSGNVARVEYFADDWSLGNSESSGTNYALEYDFFALGNRNIEAVSYDSDGLELAADSQWVEVYGSSPMPNVPYYYQLSNGYNPSGSCQNTAIAMLLSYYGYTIFPDTISQSWGTSYAQSPSGLASLFNHYANRANISQRLTPITNGTIAGLKAELDEGRPVITHGYFTSYGHILIVLGYDDGGYWVNDSAGEWAQSFGGGYPYGWSPSVGKEIYYQKEAFEAAVATSDGYNYLPLWYHIVR